MLDKVHEEVSVTARVEAHTLHVVGRELRVLRVGHLEQRLEQPHVLLLEEPAADDTTFTRITHGRVIN